MFVCFCRLRLITRFRHYNTWQEVKDAASTGADSDLLGAVNIVEKRGGPAARALVRSIYSARVSMNVGPCLCTVAIDE